jgi:hypothetical protein
VVADRVAPADVVADRVAPAVVAARVAAADVRADTAEVDRCFPPSA